MAGELRHSVQGFWFKFQKGFEHCVEEENRILITARGALFVVGPSSFSRDFYCADLLDCGNACLLGGGDRGCGESTL